MRTYDQDRGATSCHGAEATFVEGVLCCKVCYEAVALGTLPKEERDGP